MRYHPITTNYVKKIRKILRALYPEVKTQLDHRNPFELLVATILSAQCTDKQVNKVTPELFRKYKTPEEFMRAPIKELENLIHSTGFFRNKANNLKNCAGVLVRDYGGQVPNRRQDLIKLPGVGRKTANVVLGAAFGKPGIVVDTHVKRIANRLEMVSSQDPVKIEFNLMRFIPRRDWTAFSLRMILFGREYCMARNPKCPVCPLKPLCPHPGKTVL
jgi:endonuclease-3